MKKFICLLLCSFIFFLAGCSSNETVADIKISEKIVFAIPRDSTETIRSVIENFTAEKSDIDIKILELSDESGENYRILSSALAGNEVNIDVFLLEDVWMKEFISLGYVRSIADFVHIEKDEYPTVISDVFYSGEKLYAVPVELDSGIMYYRWDMTSGNMNYHELAQNGEIGFSVRMSDGEDMLSIIRDCIRLEGDTVKGLELYKKLYELSDSGMNDALNEFKNGRLAYLSSWTGQNHALKNCFGEIQGKVKAAVPVENGQIYTTARAYGAAVNAALDKSKEQAVARLLEFLVSESAQLEISKGVGTLPLKMKYYENSIVKDYNEYNELFAKYVDNLNYRPFIENYMRLSKNAQAAVNDYIAGKADISEAACAVEKIFN